MRLIHLHPCDASNHASCGRTVLATERDGVIRDGSGQGLFEHQTRLLSRYGWLIESDAPHPMALSNVEQHSWLGYSIALAPGVDPGPPDKGSGVMDSTTQMTL